MFVYEYDYRALHFNVKHTYTRRMNIIERVIFNVPTLHTLTLYMFVCLV